MLARSSRIVSFSPYFPLACHLFVRRPFSGDLCSSMILGLSGWKSLTAPPKLLLIHRRRRRNEHGTCSVGPSELSFVEQRGLSSSLQHAHCSTSSYPGGFLTHGSVLSHNAFITVFRRSGFFWGFFFSVPRQISICAHSLQKCRATRLRWEMLDCVSE